MDLAPNIMRLPTFRQIGHIGWRALRSLDKEFNSPESRWTRNPGSPKSLVFVHGLLSEAPRAWRTKRSNWPDIIDSDPTFAGWNILLANWYSTVFSEHHDIVSEANRLYDFLMQQLPTEEGQEQTIVFVCHSLGGILVRQMLVAHPDMLQRAQIGLLTLSTPAKGSKLASVLAGISARLRHSQALALRIESETLPPLDVAFKALVAGHPDRLVGMELVESHSIGPRTKLLKRLSAWSLLPKPLVGVESQGAYFGPPVIVPDTDHASISRPLSVDSPVHQLLQRFVRGHFSAEKSPEPTASLP